MPSFSRALSTAIWFGVRPTLWLEAVRRASRLIYRRNTDEFGEFAPDVVLTSDDALRALGINEEKLSFALANPDAWKEAQKKYSVCSDLMPGPVNMDFLFSLSKHLRPRVVLETGVAFGWSTLAFLSALEAGGRLISNDLPYTNSKSEECFGAAAQVVNRKQWSCFRLPDREFIRVILPFLPNRVDMVHYDSDKRKSARLWSYARLWKKLAPGGILLSDDCQDNDAFDLFAKSVSCSPIYVSDLGELTGVIRKPQGYRRD